MLARRSTCRPILPTACPRRSYVPPRVGTHPPSELRRIWLRNGATVDIRLNIPGKERWLKAQKPVKMKVTKRIISEDLLADVGELPARPPAAADAKDAVQSKGAAKLAAADKGKKDAAASGAAKGAQQKQGKPAPNDAAKPPPAQKEKPNKESASHSKS